MSALTETAAFARKAIIYSVLTIIIVSFLFLIAPFIAPLFTKPASPLPTPKPESAFGKLPPLIFPENRVYPLSFKLESIEGKPPESSTSAKVYFLPKKNPNLFSRKNALTFAQNLGFYNKPQNVTETVYKFDDQNKKTALTLDITNLNFFFQREDLDSSFFQNNTSPAENEAKSMAQAFFSNLNLFDNNFNKAKVTYSASDGVKMTPVSKPYESKVIRVDFLRADVENVPILTADYDQSNTYLIFSPKQNSSLSIENIVEASLQNFPPDLSNASTYTIISSANAWDNLENGKGFIVRALNSGTEAVVRKIYLAYFQSENYQSYLQPVFVFEGDQDFAALVSAIDPFWVGN